MKIKLIFLALLAVVGLQAAGADDLIALPVVEDVYVDFVNGQVYDTEVLKCEMDLVNKSWPVAPLIKFNISSLNVTEDDIGILVLKAATIEMRSGETLSAPPSPEILENNETHNNDTRINATEENPQVAALDLEIGNVSNENKIRAGAVVLFPADSNWTEGSGIVDLLPALNTTLEMIENEDKIDYSQVGIRFDNGDRIFAFEVSKHLKDAAGDEISFLLVAVNDDLDYRVGFNSRETGEGPHLLVMPYPSEVDGEE